MLHISSNAPRMRAIKPRLNCSGARRGLVARPHQTLCLHSRGSMSSCPRTPSDGRLGIRTSSSAGKIALDRAVDGWSCADIPDLTGKVAMLTGASGALGFEAASALAKAGAKVYMVAKEQDHADKAVEKAKARLGPGAKLTALSCDMSSLRNVTRFVREFRRASEGEKLDILYLIHGVTIPGPFALTPDGLEQTLAIDYYSQALLALGLLDRVAEAAPSRIVFQGSLAELFGVLDWDNLRGDKFDNSGLVPYGTSKLMQMLFAQKLQTLVRDKNVDIFSVHPGVVKTPMLDKMDTKHYPDGALFKAIDLAIGNSPERGALSGIYAAASAEITGKGYKYYGPGYIALNLFPFTERQPFNPMAHDESAANRMFIETTRLFESILGPDEWRPIAKAAAAVIKDVPSGARL